MQQERVSERRLLPIWPLARSTLSADKSYVASGSLLRSGTSYIAPATRNA